MRLPPQTAPVQRNLHIASISEPVTRALAGTTLSDHVMGVGASSLRSLACNLAAGAGSGACAPGGPGAMSRCYNALYNHCMGDD
jgi:hypothetical protein